MKKLSFLSWIIIASHLLGISDGYAMEKEEEDGIFSHSHPSRVSFPNETVEFDFSKNSPKAVEFIKNNPQVKNLVLKGGYSKIFANALREYCKTIMNRDIKIELKVEG